MAIYLVTEYVYNERGEALGTEPVAAFNTQEEAAIFLSAQGIGDEIAEVPWNPSPTSEFKDKTTVLYSGNIDGLYNIMSEFLSNKRGKKPRSLNE